MLLVQNLKSGSCYFNQFKEFIMKKIIIVLFSVLFVLSCKTNNLNKKGLDNDGEKTAFQTSNPWKPVTDVRADVAIVYGAGDRRASNNRSAMTFEERVQSWRDHGYITHFMTGIAWGNYQDYFTGQWDGEWHLDEGQVTAHGDTLWHGNLVPYLVPSENFLKYMKEVHVKRVIDAGIDAIYMEEPEFWMRAGYSEAFKREWQDYYGFEWRPQHESPENTYLANKLKYHLYYRALEDVFTFAKEYGKSKGLDVRCYVPTHSLVNYSQWMIVSPEASLASLSCVDGYIAQVWTGTSRAQNFFNGVDKERVFETAFLEYGSMESMTAPTGRKLFFLTDPIEDRARDWVDYKKNYQATFTAKLLYPNIADYEVMPWPDRIYEGLYKTNPNSNEREQIPRYYSTQMQVMINTLNFMPLSDNMLSGTPGISVMMSNSLMFQRFPNHAGYEDPDFSNFYGQTLPFVKRGVPVKTLHIENVSYQETWKDTKVLIMSYSNMKPMDEKYHRYIAEWVKNGGVLVYTGKDTDPYQTVLEWWNSNGNKYRAPVDHLFELMDFEAGLGDGEYKYGKGILRVIRIDPKEYVLEAEKDADFVSIVKKLYEENVKAGKMIFKNNFYLERGPYTMIATLDESVSNEPYILNGNLIDLFDPKLPILKEKVVKPGEQAYLFSIDRVENKKQPQVLAAASRVYDESRTKKSYSFITKSPLNTTNVMRILLPEDPLKITIGDNNGNIIPSENLWDKESKTCFLTFENNPDGVQVAIEW
jgi:hypothetical protein